MTDKLIQVNMRNVKLTNDSRKTLCKIKDEMWGNVAEAIECGNWWIPCKNRNYKHMKSEFEKGMYDFYDIPKDVKVEIEDFNTDIVSYDEEE